MRLKWVGLVAVVGLVALAAFTYQTREANPYCGHKVAQEASCHGYTYWWDH